MRGEGREGEGSEGKKGEAHKPFTSLSPLTSLSQGKTFGASRSLWELLQAWDDLAKLKRILMQLLMLMLIRIPTPMLIPIRARRKNHSSESCLEAYERLQASPKPLASFSQAFHKPGERLVRGWREAGERLGS